MKIVLEDIVFSVYRKYTFVKKKINACKSVCSDTPSTGAGASLGTSGNLLGPSGPPLHLQMGVWSFMRLNNDPHLWDIQHLKLTHPCSIFYERLS